MSISIGLTDDHQLLRTSLAEMLTNKGFKVVLQAGNGKECLNQLKAGATPDIILMDISMPIMDGYETTLSIKKDYPHIKVLVITMHESEELTIKMLRAGAKGYILKNGNSRELVNAINTLHTKGFYANDLLTTNMLNSFNKTEYVANDGEKKITPREIEFLKLSCSELSYKEIALEMNVSQRTVDGYREDLFKKLDIHTRVGLVLYAIKNELIKL